MIDFPLRKIMAGTFRQAQFQLASSVQVQLRTAIRLINHCETTPPPPDKYIRATSRLPRKLKFGMEALFNQTRSASQLASH